MIRLTKEKQNIYDGHKELSYEYLYKGTLIAVFTGTDLRPKVTTCRPKSAGTFVDGTRYKAFDNIEEADKFMATQKEHLKPYPSAKRLFKSTDSTPTKAHTKPSMRNASAKTISENIKE